MLLCCTAHMNSTVVMHLKQQKTPKLHSLSSLFGSDPLDASKIQREEEPSQKTKKVERDAKKVRRMYNLAQSNEASTQRIMKKCKHEFFDRPAVSDLIAVDGHHHVSNERPASEAGSELTSQDLL